MQWIAPKYDKDEEEQTTPKVLTLLTILTVSTSPAKIIQCYDMGHLSCQAPFLHHESWRVIKVCVERIGMQLVA
jgi:hypothetical protein